ncbi:MAG: hypothetical protein KDC92_11915 [Bacteroidetes bacterium]|nr:hypothetical protein [Bacteroidota bacterium]
MKSIFTVLCTVLGLVTLAQDAERSLKDFKRLEARSIGPAGMSGRITSIDVVESSPEIIYAGTASGGLWRSESGGIGWQAIFDDQPTQSIGAVAIQQTNPDVVWVGTGEGNPRNSQTSGAGIYKSIDGGKSWKCMGLEATKTIHRVIISPENPDVVWVGALGSAWGDNAERGVYKTTDGGKTWNKVLYINQSTGCADLVIDPSNPNKLIAAMWQYQRQPWFFTSGGEGSGLFVSFDGGETWKKRTDKDGLPKGTLGRMGLSIAPSNPKIIYALVESEEKYALYQSTDGGFKWHMQSNNNVGNRPFYYADIYVDPANENRIYNLWSYVSLSEDAGRTFKTILDYGTGVHPDHHAFWVHPKNASYVIEGNDGGLNISHDRGKTWRMAENIPVGQFYHIDIDNETPYNIYGGMQDNGSWVGPSYTWNHGGIRNHDWQELYFGDGFDVLPDKTNSRYGYAMSQGGNVVRYDRESGKNWTVKPCDLPDQNLRFNWNAAMADDPHNEQGLFFGSQFLHHSVNAGQSWELLSPDLTSNNPEKQQQAKSGGLTIDATQAENYTTITAIAPSALNKNIIWVGTDDGNLQLTTDFGKTWNNLYKKLKGAPEGGWIPQIVTSTHNQNVAFVIVNNYRQNDWKPYAYVTTDGGKSFDKLVSDKWLNSYCLSIVQDPVEPNLLFLGTENGLYVSFDFGKNWEQFKNGVPSVSVMDLKIHPREHDLVIGTFGRAVLVVDNISPLRSLCKQKNEPLELFRPIQGIIANYAQAKGVRFTAQAHFKGMNRPSGMRIPFYIHSSILKPKSKAMVVIYNEVGDTVRHYETKVDTGLNFQYWYFETNGERGPSHRMHKNDEMPPGGMQVPPGNYKVRVYYESTFEEAPLIVQADPRVSFSQNDYNQQLDLYKTHLKYKVAVREAVEQLYETQGQISDALEMFEESDTTLKALKKEGKSLQDSINKLVEIVLLPKDFVGYDHATKRLSDRLHETENYIQNSMGQLSQMAHNSLELEKAETTEFLKLVNAFLTESVNPFALKVENLALQPLKQAKSIKLDE